MSVHPFFLVLGALCAMTAGGCASDLVKSPAVEVLVAEPEVLSLGAGETSPAAEINQVAWLEGTWVGEGLGRTAEEVFSSPVGGQMMGMFRHYNADQSLNFYEFYLIVETQGSLALQLKHFNPNFHGWEEKDKYVEFPLVKISENSVNFDGLTFMLTRPDELTAVVNLGDDGIGKFQYRRQK